MCAYFPPKHGPVKQPAFWQQLLGQKWKYVSATALNPFTQICTQARKHFASHMESRARYTTTIYLIKEIGWKAEGNCSHAKTSYTHRSMYISTLRG